MDTGVLKSYFPVKLVLILLISIFVIEFVVMLLIKLFSLNSFWQAALIDATLIVFLIFPILLKCQIKPLKTEIKKRISTEAEIRKMNNELKAVNSERDKLYSIIAHDLRSPFNSLIGLSDTLLQKSRESSLSREDVLKYADCMHKSTTSLYGLLDNLLLWSSSSQSSSSFPRQSLNLFSLINTQIEFLRESADMKRIGIFSLIPQDLQVIANANVLNTVIRNLISNAVKFTPEGGLIKVSCRKKEDRYLIEVSDTGIGMDQDMILNLLSPDKITRRSGTTGEMGTGLGLILCKGILEQHNSSMSIESEPGKGSKFTITV